MDNPLAMKKFKPEVHMLKLDSQLDVPKRLADLYAWLAEWQIEDKQLEIEQLKCDDNRKADVIRANQIINLRRSKELRIVRQPIFIDSRILNEVKYSEIRSHMSSQYAAMNPVDQKVWLTNLRFLLTPNLLKITTRFNKLRIHRYRIGQQRGLLLGGETGSGKTSFLDWFAACYLPVILDTFNHVAVNKVDAPVSNRTAKALLEEILMNLGKVSLDGDEQDLIRKIIMLFSNQHVELLVIDQIDHLRTDYLRRRILELLNKTCVPIIAAAVDPVIWVENDPELKGRFLPKKDQKPLLLEPFVGGRLDSFLTMVDLLLPFVKDSQLGVRQITDETGKKLGDGLAHHIEQWTGGSLREIMRLILEASLDAIEKGESCLSYKRLVNTWEDIEDEEDAFDFHKIVDAINL